MDVALQDASPADFGLLRTPYDVRPVRYLDLLSIGPWRFKLYGISASFSRGEDLLNPVFLAAGRDVVRNEIETNPIFNQRTHNVGFVVLHQGRLGNWLLLDWWSHDVLWNQILFRSETVRDPDFRKVTTGVVACTWEMPLLAFERDSWVREVLCAGREVDTPTAISRYLNSCFNADL